jgi:KaiC/GvpD/RAD55 family RecA-like ATPase
MTSPNTDTEPKFIIRTGIPSLDGLFSPTAAGEEPSGGITLPRSATTSFCILGPDGTGKSVLAMHLASRYLADCIALGGVVPMVFYVSSDLTHVVAKEMWAHFALGAPNTRQIPFAPRSGAAESGAHDPNLSLALVHWPPGKVGTIPKKRKSQRRNTATEPVSIPDVLPSPARNEVAFIDIASEAAGDDDWTFVNELLRKLPKPESDGDPRHVVILDAMEGFETLGSASMNPSPRRIRVATLIRLAFAKCHLVLIGEEPQEDVRTPEQFVADVVLRLRTTDSRGYLRRTLEIEKARGQDHVRGRHPYVIRSGGGSSTGDWVNYDDPELPVTEENPRKLLPILSPVDRKGRQCYVQLFPSLHYVSRTIMKEHGPGRRLAEPRSFAAFGIPHLDDTLGRAECVTDDCSDDCGLPCSTTTALIGDAGTQKTGLAVAFLAEAFGKFARELEHCCITSELIRTLGKKHAGVAVMITTRDETTDSVVREFISHLERHYPWLRDPGSRSEFREFVQSRTVCRRLEVHDMPSAVLFHIIQRSVEAAQLIVTSGKANPVKNGGLDRKTTERCASSGRIRLVINDFSTIMDTYAQVRDDPLFLPFTMFYLGREGPTTLILDTHPGRPDPESAEAFHSDLRTLADHTIYTWRVTAFYGEHRVAIAAIPPVSADPQVRVRELKWKPHGARETPIVNPDFELYSGLESNQPRPVALQVRLYAETEQHKKHIDRVNRVFETIFTPVSGLATDQFVLPPAATAHSAERPRIVCPEEIGDYNRLQDFCHLHGGVKLDHTIVLQVDEFWANQNTLRSQVPYLMTRTTDRLGNCDSVADPYGQYQTQPIVRRAKAPYRKRDFFDTRGYEIPADVAVNALDVDRVPFTWDFGFLALSEDSWKNAIKVEELNGESDLDRPVQRVWRAFEDTSRCTSISGIASEWDENRDWSKFLRACVFVAESERASGKNAVAAFDLAMPSPESFSCLLLEIWASEILRSERLGLLSGGNRDVTNEVIDQLATRKWDSVRRGTNGLITWLSGEPAHGDRSVQRFRGFSLELYRSWLLLIEALDLSSFENVTGAFAFKDAHEANSGSVATRHWYKTAVARDKSGGDRGVRYCRLPGHFSTRGDWFLAVARGSRSSRLGDLALDLLCSTRGNMRRLLVGLGLPTRHLTNEGDFSRFGTRLEQRSHEPAHVTSTLTYGDVLNLGSSETNCKSEKYYWLWRSGLAHYHHQAMIWQNWSYRILRRWQKLRVAAGHKWISGFRIYDLLDQAAGPRGDVAEKACAELEALPSFRDFPDRCEDLLAQLRLSARTTDCEKSQ